MDDGFDKRGMVDELAGMRAAASERVRAALGPGGLVGVPPLRIAELANEALDTLTGAGTLSLGDQRQILRDVVDLLTAEQTAAMRGPDAPAEPMDDPLNDPLADIADVKAAGTPEVKHRRALQVKQQVMPLLMQRIDISVASSLGPDQLRAQIAEIVEEIIIDLLIQLNAAELRNIVRLLVADMVGSGPLEPLLHDASISDIMVDGPYQVYVERKGKVELTDVVFRDDPHVLHVATR